MKLSDIYSPNWFTDSGVCQYSHLCRAGEVTFVYNIELKCSLEKFIEIGLVIKIGSIDEDIEKNGLSHVFEHMYVYYLKRKIGKDKIVEHQIKINAYTEFDHILFSVKCLKECFSILIKEMILALTSLDVNIKVLNYAKKEVVQECLKYNEKNVRQEKIVEELTQNKIQTLPIGNKVCLENITNQDINTFLSDKIAAANKMFFIFGNIDDSDSIFLNMGIKKQEQNKIKNHFFRRRYHVIKIDEFLFIKYNKTHFDIYTRACWELFKEIICLFLESNNCSFCYEKNISSYFRFIYLKVELHKNYFHNLSEIITFITPQILEKAKVKTEYNFTYAEEHNLFLSPEYLRKEYINQFLYGDFIMGADKSKEMIKIIRKIDKKMMHNYITKIWEI